MEEEKINIVDVFINISELVKYLLTKWLLIIIFIIIGSLTGILFSLNSGTKYSSTLKFIVEEGDKNAGGLSSLASSFGFGANSEGIFNSSNIIDLIQMRSLVEKALLRKVPINKNKTFAQIYIEQYEMNKEWYKKDKLKNIVYLPQNDREKFSIEKDSILGVIHINLLNQKQLIVEQKNKDNSILEISLETENEIFSRYFSESLIEVVGEYYINTKTKQVKENIISIEKQIDSVRNELNSAMLESASGMDNVFSLNPAMNIKRVPSSKKQIDVQANISLLTELIKNSELTKLKLMNQTPLVEIVDRPVLPLKKIQIGKLYGAIIGGFIFGFMTIVVLLTKRFIKKLMINNK